MSRTHEEILDIIRDHMSPEEVVEAIGISPDDLADCLAIYIEINFDNVVSGLEASGF